jgi:hypothetical protein
MNDRRLIAAIPVVEAVAAIQGRGTLTARAGWKMPYGNLYEDLKTRTQKRIIRGDGDVEQEKKAFERNPTDIERSVQLTYGPNDLWAQLSFSLDSA